MKDVMDTHTHTIVSGHAYNTMTEMMQAAAEKGLELLAITDHAPKMPGSTHPFYFSNSSMIDRDYYTKKFGGKTRYLIGSELNILPGGNIDLSEETLKKLDIVLASLHTPCYKPATKEEHTHDYLRILENPLIHIIAHPDDGRYPVDFEVLVKAAKANHKILELNNHSLDPLCTRENAREHDICMLKFCMEYQQPIIINSDAHIETEIGNHARGWQLIEELGFPEELVLNTSVEKLLNYLS
ncbi:MAG: phosphatase [Lachnospiraceae bacterium]|nr:phosphatase [Lachnospiraceae bacterium]